ncbi:hypothetical protein I7I50_02621 [Histoplasma capsulatum G186AR]|uniref:Uncharacterized protein n=1 Tax=Ajellomyces capsulatus TaxID=5037 RepID=A0A8H8D6L5_AJECA|nr:hypothetical protein I7I52_00716 [Histoplasma capsulatum]QSS71686.1 hypothetical protein I7I50_02621 [Histoplasma capsulatum G186AR]
MLNVRLADDLTKTDGNIKTKPIDAQRKEKCGEGLRGNDAASLSSPVKPPPPPPPPPSQHSPLCSFEICMKPF